VISAKAVGPPADVADAAPQPEKKHGFWFRVFHGGHETREKASDPRSDATTKGQDK
jgi:hypothetical protein